MVACYLGAHILRVARLWLLVSPDDRPLLYRRVFSINTVGFLAINVIPLRLGEMVRPYLLWEREGVPLGHALAGILVERMLDMLALLGLLFGVGFVLDLPLGGLVVEGVDVVQAGQRAIGSGVAVGILGLIAVAWGGERVFMLVRRLPLGTKIVPLLARFRDGLVLLARQPQRMALLLLLTVGIWMLTIGGVWSVMSGFENMPSGFGMAWVTWAATITTMTLFPTPGFFGPYELACSRVLWLFGVDASLAGTFALVLHLGQFGFTLFLGTLFLGIEGLSLRDLIRPATVSDGVPNISSDDPAGV